jgi:hypothetical protein
MVTPLTLFFSIHLDNHRQYCSSNHFFPCQHYYHLYASLTVAYTGWLLHSSFSFSIFFSIHLDNHRQYCSSLHFFSHQHSWYYLYAYMLNSKSRFNYSSIRLFEFSTIPIFEYSSFQLFEYSTIWVFNYSTALCSDDPEWGWGRKIVMGSRLAKSSW